MAIDRAVIGFRDWDGCHVVSPSPPQRADGPFSLPCPDARLPLGRAPCRRFDAGVAKLVDAPDLGSGIARCGGSSPFAAPVFQTRIRPGDASAGKLPAKRRVGPVERIGRNADCRDAERRPQARLHADHSRQGHRGDGRCRGQEGRAAGADARLRPGRCPRTSSARCTGRAPFRRAQFGDPERRDETWHRQGLPPRDAAVGRTDRRLRTG